MDDYDEVRKSYNKIARNYHEKRQNPKSASWNDYLESPAMDSVLEPIVKSKQILDLGCGTGLLTNKIRNWGGSVYGTDISDRMIEIARENYESIDFRVSDTSGLPFADNRFDIVASSLVMHYIRDLNPAFAEIARVLKTSGEFVFTMHHPLNESIDMNRSDKQGDIIVQSYFNDFPYHWRMCGEELLSFHHTFENIIRSLKSAGFVLLDLIECRPDSNVKEDFDDYLFTSQYPTFCLFHAKKS